MFEERINEAERQVLIALIELQEPVETPNNNFYTFYPANLEAAAAYFRSLREDWSAAYASLSARGLLAAAPGGWRLTGAGAEFARRERLDHPPIWYWYREFFPLAARSRAYQCFCTQLYEVDLQQAGFSDRKQIDDLVARGALGAQTRLLDLGCGLGGVAEYISDATGACAWGLDYTPEAVRLAKERTAAKRARLDFYEGNLDHLEAFDRKFDTLLSIDSIYMPNQLSETLLNMKTLLEPGGQMLIFYSCFVFDPNAPREWLEADRSPLAQALQDLGMAYRAWDYTEDLFHLMRRKRKLALAMQAEFAAEGADLLYDFLYNESDGGEGPFEGERWNISRYLYRVTPARGTRAVWQVYEPRRAHKLHR